MQSHLRLGRRRTYRALADMLAEMRQAITTERSELDARERELGRLEIALAQRSGTLAERQREVEAAVGEIAAHHAELKQREVRLQEAEAALQETQDEARRHLSAMEARREALAAREERLLPREAAVVEREQLLARREEALLQLEMQVHQLAGRQLAARRVLPMGPENAAPPSDERLPPGMRGGQRDSQRGAGRQVQVSFPGMVIGGAGEEPSPVTGVVAQMFGPGGGQTLPARVSYGEGEA